MTQLCENHWGPTAYFSLLLVLVAKLYWPCLRSVTAIAKCMKTSIDLVLGSLLHLTVSHPTQILSLTVVWHVWNSTALPFKGLHPLLLHSEPRHHLFYFNLYFIDWFIFYLMKEDPIIKSLLGTIHNHANLLAKINVILFWFYVVRTEKEKLKIMKLCMWQEA